MTMTHGFDRRIERGFYLGWGFCQRCGACGSVFEIYRKSPTARQWRLKAFRVVHHALSDACLGLHNPKAFTGSGFSCTVPKHVGEVAYWMGHSMNLVGCGGMDRATIDLIAHGHDSRWEAYVCLEGMKKRGKRENAQLRRFLCLPKDATDDELLQAMFEMDTMFMSPSRRWGP